MFCRRDPQSDLISPQPVKSEGTAHIRKLRLTTADGDRVSALAQGTTGAGRREDAAPDSVHRREELLRLGLDLGMTFLDTGEHYEEGHAEEIVGRVIQGRREQLFLGSKFAPYHNSRAGVMQAFEGSLRRLKTDYLDLYQMQWPNPAVPLEETISALMMLLDAQRIRYAGICNVTPLQLAAAQRCSGNRIAAVQIEYNLMNRTVEAELMPTCQQNGITLIGYSPFSQGRQSFSRDERALLQQLSDKYGATVHQLIIAWMLTHADTAVLTRSMNQANITANAAAARLVIEDADVGKINRLFVRDIMNVDTGRIRLHHGETPEPSWIYHSLQEAIENGRNMQPGPVELAREIEQVGLLKPVELMPTTNRSGDYDYDLIHGQVRYWAWILAYGSDRPIPANIIKGERIRE